MANMEDVERERKTCNNTATNIHLAHCKGVTKLKTDNHSHSIDTVAFCSLSINPVSENQVAIFNPILSLAATLASPIMNDMSQLP